MLIKICIDNFTLEIDEGSHIYYGTGTDDDADLFIEWDDLDGKLRGALCKDLRNYEDSLEYFGLPQTKSLCFINSTSFCSLLKLATNLYRSQRLAQLCN